MLQALLWLHRDTSNSRQSFHSILAICSQFSNKVKLLLLVFLLFTEFDVAPLAASGTLHAGVSVSRIYALLQYSDAPASRKKYTCHRFIDDSKGFVLNFPCYIFSVHLSLLKLTGYGEHI